MSKIVGSILTSDIKIVMLTLLILPLFYADDLAVL